LEFHPRVMVCESFRSRQPITSDNYLSPVKVAQRLEFCTETGYVICPFYWQTADDALDTASDDDLELWGLHTDKPGQERDATRHAITFIRRAKADTALRDSAWGSDEARFGPARRGSARLVRRLYLTDEPGLTPKAENEELRTITRRRDVPYQCRRRASTGHR
jgi:hypothetical protein